MNTRYLFILLSFLVSSLFSISSVAAETLSAITNNTTQRLKQIYNVNPEKLQDNVKSINRWLQGPASLQLIALPSNTQGGTDEYEVGVFFPFRSPAGRELDAQQLSITNALDNLQETRFRLMTSGLIREALWQRLFAKAEVDGLLKKQEWIASLDGVIAGLAKTGELDRIASLRWQQEKLSQQLALKKAQMALEKAQKQYKQVTGTDVLPEQVTEALAGDLENKLQTHPELRLLTLSQSQIDMNLAQSDQSLSPWVLGVIARQLRGPAGNENLLGVSINIPLPMGEGNSANNYASWKATRDELTEALAETYTRLQTQLNDALQQVNYLTEATNNLEEQVELGVEIADLYQQQGSVLPKTFWLEQLIAQQELKLTLSLNRLRRAEAISKVNQIAGVTL